MAGTRLEVLPCENTTWAAWRESHPDTLVLSFDTGYSRDYDVDPYESYPIRRDPALCVSSGALHKIYPYRELRKARAPVVDHFGQDEVTIVFNRRSRTVRVETRDPRRIAFFVSFLEDLKAFYPEAEIYRASHR